MTMLAAVKKLVTGAPATALDKAIEQRIAARAELERVTTAQDEAIRVAREAFEKDSTEAAADTVVRIEARAKLLVGAAEKKVREASAAVEKEEAAEKAVRLAELDAIVEGVQHKVAALAPKATQHILALGEVARERDVIVNEAIAAYDEACRLRGENNERAWPKRQALDMQRGMVLRQRIAEAVDITTRERVQKLLDGGPFA